MVERNGRGHARVDEIGVHPTLSGRRRVERPRRRTSPMRLATDRVEQGESEGLAKGYIAAQSSVDPGLSDIGPDPIEGAHRQALLAAVGGATAPPLEFGDAELPDSAALRSQGLGKLQDRCAVAQCLVASLVLRFPGNTAREIRPNRMAPGPYPSVEGSQVLEEGVVSGGWDRCHACGIGTGQDPGTFVGKPRPFVRGGTAQLAFQNGTSAERTAKSPETGFAQFVPDSAERPLHRKECNPSDYKSQSAVQSLLADDFLAPRATPAISRADRRPKRAWRNW